MNVAQRGTSSKTMTDDFAKLAGDLVTAGIQGGTYVMTISLSITGSSCALLLRVVKNANIPQKLLVR